ncbi:MAG: hypothetical protein CMJ62_12835 [Planctomycetaceae bacterium]|nr:hypothetical protein [Planctomycetaceae bacterium]
MKEKTRLGLYMFTPIIGGAEQYLKDLVWNIQRERYEITLFYDSWKDLEEFLELDACPDVCGCPIGLFEVRRRSGKKRPDKRPRLFGRFMSSGPVRAVKRALVLLYVYAMLPINFLLLWLAFRKHKVDILHIVNGGYPGAITARLAAIVAKLSGTKRCIMSVCNTPAPVAFPGIDEWLIDHCVARSLDTAVLPSDTLGRSLIERRGFPQAKVETIPYGVRCAEELARLPREVTRQSDSAPLIGMVANFLTHKGHEHLVRAMASLKSRFPALRAILIGDGPTRGAIQELVEKEDLADRVTFSGFCELSETLSLMATLDMLVHPSELEGMPYVILHAMSLGKPVIASNVGSIRDILHSGESGIVVPARDSNVLAEAIASLLSDRAKLQRMGAAALDRYCLEFSLKRMLQQHESLYDRIVKQTGRDENACASTVITSPARALPGRKAPSFREASGKELA